MRLLMVAMLLGGVFIPDLDVGIPPGTPLDWNRDLPRPVPTGHRGQPPKKLTEGVETPGGGGGKTPNSTETQKPPKKPLDIEYMILNAQEYWLGTSKDATNHLKWKTPPPTKPDVTQDDTATEGGFIMTWNYPPNFPAELIWAGLSASLREKLHPNGVSWPEAAAHCLEIGEPALVGADVAEGADLQVLNYLKSELSAKLPPKPPTPSRNKDPKEAMLIRLAAIELTGGFPHALDPAFGRRTLALGDEAYNAVLDSAWNSHIFLARNAVSVLGNFPRPEAQAELVKLWRGSRDQVLKFRALRALAQRGEKSIAPDLITQLDSSVLPEIVIAMYALGFVGDATAIGPIIKQLQKKGDKKGGVAGIDLNAIDWLWTAIPALGRLKAKDELIALEARLNQKIGFHDDTPASDPSPHRVFRQMCVLALAAMGEKKYVDEVAIRVEKHGLDNFHTSTHYLLIDTLSRFDRGIDILHKVLASDYGMPTIRTDVLRTLLKVDKIKPPVLKELALREKEISAVRGRAIQGLASRDPITAKEVCRTLLEVIAKGELPIEAGRAYVLTAAAQSGGMLDALDVALLVKCTERAFNGSYFARREGNNEANLAEVRIVVCPPLLETLVIELGRTARPEALPILKSILEKKRYPQGRAEAAIALGMITGKESDALLMDALDDKDGWVRYCAYKSLALHSKQDNFCDWIFGDKQIRSKAFAAYQAWFKETYPK